MLRYTYYTKLRLFLHFSKHSLFQETTRLKSDMVAMETAVQERLGYLQRYKVGDLVAMIRH